MSSRWITNLESVTVLEQRLYDAKQRAASEPTAENKGAVDMAKYLLADVRRTYAQIEKEHPGYGVAEPMATEQRTAAEIAADGIVGLYRTGAGTSPVVIAPPLIGSLTT